ncbi:hypothetical protein HGO38_19510 [Rhizobium sp. CG5]|uniref:hypothetical protein n=1 Tax=Rhizobium sp. CG5 TaxID=2726076 RepID=UPI002033E618|nr:hypothetical protein [Rhizobium sp. CG5]MCM2475666.1 hypothetical protein [Rhizobium sp. CG5]
MKTGFAHAAGDDACDFRNIYKPYPPYLTLKCIGDPLFRSQRVRDYACLLDLDPDVISWRCTPEAIVNQSGAARPRWWHVDLAVETSSEARLVEIWQTSTGGPSWLPRVAEQMGYRLQPVSMLELDQIRLQNSKDLMRYVGSEVPLGDRVRIFAALDEMGTLTLTECLSAIRESKSMHTIASMVLSGLLEVDLDAALIGPDTVVRRAAK